MSGDSRHAQCIVRLANNPYAPNPYAPNSAESRPKTCQPLQAESSRS